MAAEIALLPNVGDVVDRYRVVAEVARGGMAVLFAVTRVESEGFEKLLAMKMMLPHLATDAHFVKMFLDEARVAARVEHRNVVQVFEVGQARGAPFLIMELLRGRSASDLASMGRLPLGVALDVIAQAAEGLHAAHEAEDASGAPLALVHRDVSPQNLFVCASGDVKVVDFGIARARGRQAATRTDELKGKLSYIAPEQITRAYPVTRAADLWSLGVVAWELIAGRRLFEPDGHEAATLWNVVEGPIDDVRRFAPDVPEEARAIVHRCLERVPSARPSTGAEVARAFHEAARRLGGGVATTAALVRERCGAALAEEAARLATATKTASVPVDPAPETKIDALSASVLEASVPSRAETTAAPRRRIALAGGVLALALATAWMVRAASASRQAASAEGATSAPVGMPSVDSSPVAISPPPASAPSAAVARDVTPLEAPAPSSSAARVTRRSPSKPLHAHPTPGGSGASTPLLRNPF